MRIFKRLTLLYIAVLVSCAVMPLPLMAESIDSPGNTDFILENAQSASADEIVISVVARDVEDVYAYEVTLAYESRKLELVDTLSGIPGLSVNPILSNDQIRFAHTQIGNIPGRSGDLKLATFIFKKLHKGNSSIRLSDVSLVASNLDMKKYKPGNALRVKDTSVHIVLTDIAGHWAETKIEQAISLGFVEGYADDTFRPQRKVTRGEFVTMLSRVLELEPVMHPQQPYSDDSLIPVWARAHIYAAAERELVFAFEDRSFRADRPITRVEMTAVLARVLEDGPEAGKLEYKDADEIPAWGYEAAAKATAAGLVQGKPGSRFAPNEQATRAEVVAVILNLMSVIGKDGSE